MTNTEIFRAESREELERKLDEIIKEGKPFRDIPLILPAMGSLSRSTYKDFTIRSWQNRFGACVWDTAVEFL